MHLSRMETKRRRRRRGSRSPKCEAGILSFFSMAEGEGEGDSHIDLYGPGIGGDSGSDSFLCSLLLYAHIPYSP